MYIQLELVKQAPEKVCSTYFEPEIAGCCKGLVSQLWVSCLRGGAGWSAIEGNGTPREIE
jgi:hypothetical protein